MKYGVFGGTFDPPHLGHLEAAKAVRAALGLDEVVIVPANRNPLKTRRATSATHRLKMCSLLVAGEEGLTVSDIEITRGGPSYMVDTIEELKMVRPGDYWLILGADALHTLPEWREPRKLAGLCRIAAVAREDVALDTTIAGLGPDFQYSVDKVPMTEVPVSSSKIREEFARGLVATKWLSQAVREYIENIGLYRE
ncbi:MAG: nicotinate (nicotinamide) nucleotide adenylyltransferase [Armatimonadetes bacterium]|nr:nicotinate (nicotinamide) nucleotide adenylyltransferase [Armatimonadota bacterium]